MKWQPDALSIGLFLDLSLRFSAEAGAGQRNPWTFTGGSLAFAGEVSALGRFALSSVTGDGERQTAQQNTNQLPIAMFHQQSLSLKKPVPTGRLKREHQYILTKSLRTPSGTGPTSAGRGVPGASAAGVGRRPVLLGQRPTVGRGDQSHGARC